MGCSSQAAIAAATANPVFVASTGSLGAAPKIGTIAYDGTGATLVFDYDLTLLPPGTDQSLLGIWRFDMLAGAGQFGGAVDTVNHTIAYQTTSFSPFALGVAVPEPGSIVLAALGILRLAGWEARRIKSARWPTCRNCVETAASGEVDDHEPHGVCNVLALRGDVRAEVRARRPAGRARHGRRRRRLLARLHLSQGGRDRRCARRSRSAPRAGVADGQTAVLENHVHTGEVPVQYTDDMREGVVSLPHGWGHAASTRWQHTAGERPGVSANDWTDDRVVESVVGQSILNGVRVRLKAKTLTGAVAGGSPQVGALSGQ